MKKFVKVVSVPDMKQAANRNNNQLPIYDYENIDIDENIASLLKNKKYFIRTYGCQGNLRDSEIIAGILVSPASFDALTLLSPAIISYPFILLLTIIGWNTPCSLMDAANSEIASSLNIRSFSFKPNAVAPNSLPPCPGSTTTLIPFRGFFLLILGERLIVNKYLIFCKCTKIK